MEVMPWFFFYFLDDYWSSTPYLQHSTHWKFILMKFIYFKILQWSPYWQAPTSLVYESWGWPSTGLDHNSNLPSKIFFPTSRSSQESEGFFLPTSYIQGHVRWSRQEDQGRRESGSREGKVPCALHQEFLFLVHEYLGSERPVSFEYQLLRDLVYKEAMCEGSSGNGLPYAAKAVP